MSGSVPIAASIPVPDVLKLLDGEYKFLAEGVAKGKYAFWLGSGISRGRAAGLTEVVEQVVEFLRVRIDGTRPDCPYGRAFDEAIALADLPADEAATVDRATAVSRWSCRGTLVRRLVNLYADLLDIRIGTEVADYLLWTAVDVRTTFRRNLPPDCEHICVAILALEGAVPAIACANWDGLLESSFAELSAMPEQALVVCIRAEDLRLPGRLTRLLKFHGCAVLAGENEGEYRRYLIARKGQMMDWRNNDDYKLMRRKLVDLATERPTLMVGLSAQDSNIQEVFLDARAVLDWRWNRDQPAHVFAEDQLAKSHRDILKVIYQDEYSAELEERTRIRAYGKPLLTALVLFVVAEKMRAFLATLEVPGFDAPEREKLAEGLVQLRNRIAQVVGADHLSFIQNFAEAHSRGVALFRTGQSIGLSDDGLRPLSAVPVDRVVSEPSLQTGGVPALAAALALLGSGEHNGHWNLMLSPGAAGSRGAVTASTASGASAIYFVANGQAAARLFSTGTVQADAHDAVIVHSTQPTPAMSRSPRTTFGRTSAGGPRHVAMASLLENCRDAEDLMDEFRHAGAL